MLIESVKPGSAAERVAAALPLADKALLLKREGVPTCLESINGWSVHGASTYAEVLQRLRGTGRPLTITLRTHSLGTEPRLLASLSALLDNGRETAVDSAARTQTGAAAAAAAAFLSIEL